MASLKWSENALEDLASIDSVIAERIVAKAAWLEEHFEDIIPEKLHRDLKRVSDYRVIYSMRSGVIVIQAVGHRRDIYR